MKKHILSVDDEADIRDLLKEILTVKGFRVSTAGSSREAMRIIRADPPNLVISDFQMEDTDGFALVEDIKKVLPDVPVLLLTGIVFDPEVVDETIRKKVSGYLDKTASLDAILSEVQRLIVEPPAKQG